MNSLLELEYTVEAIICKYKAFDNFQCLAFLSFHLSYYVLRIFSTSRMNERLEGKNSVF